MKGKALCSLPQLFTSCGPQLSVGLDLTRQVLTEVEDHSAAGQKEQDA